MGNNKKTRHHTVPQVYLKNFAVDDKKLLVAKLEHQKVIPMSISDVSVIQNFYSLPPSETLAEDAIEDLLADSIEGPTKRIFEILKNEENSWPLTEEDRDILLRFIAVQFLRGANMREYANYMHYVLFNLVCKSVRNEITSDFYFEVVEKMANGELEVDPQHHLHILLDLEYYLPFFFGRRWGIIRFDDDNLLTCDSPVVVTPTATTPIEIDKVLYDSKSFLNKDLGSSPVIIFPVSRNVGLVMLSDNWENGKDLEEIATGIYDFVIPATPELLTFFRESIIANASKDIYCNLGDSSILPSPLPAFRVPSQIFDVHGFVTGEYKEDQID